MWNRALSFLWFRAPLALLLFPQARAEAPKPAAAPPETVLCTYHVKKGRENAIASTIGKAWELYRRMDLVLSQTHVVLRGTDQSDQAYFVEIFTWKSAD